MFISILNFFTLDNESSLAFAGGRLVGLVAGLALSAILGQFVFIALPASFVFGALILSLSILVSLVASILPIILAENKHLRKKTYSNRKRTA